MDDQPKPMLDAPLESARPAVDRSYLPAELPEHEKQRIEQFMQAAAARFGELTGLTFDWKTGACTTPGEVKMDDEQKVRWEALHNQLGAERDAQKVEQLWREMGKLMREAVQQGTGATDGEDRQNE
jgi:hypothetical protein